MALALFDLDNTLLGGDSDYEWGQFLVEQGVVDAAHYEAANRRFYEEYKAGKLDIYAFARFSYQPLTEHPLDQLHAWRQQYIEEKIHPMLLAQGKKRIQWHRQRNDTVVIITATSRFITSPIAELFQADDLLATEPEFINGAYTGEIAGIPCFQEGKVKRLDLWLKKHDKTVHGLEDSWFYSDSHNDIPLLEQVSYPVAVDPDDALLKVASERSWDITSFRQPE